MGDPLTTHLPEQSLASSQNCSTTNPVAKENINYIPPQFLRPAAPWGTTTARTRLVCSLTSCVMVKTTVGTDLMKTRSSAVRLGPSRAGQSKGPQRETGKLDLDLWVLQRTQSGNPGLVQEGRYWYHSGWDSQCVQGHLTAESCVQWP